MITLTFVRHGESTDNLKSAWSGWKDAPLSNHGFQVRPSIQTLASLAHDLSAALQQAKACGEYFASLPITAIFASPLKRALVTAQKIQELQESPTPPLTITELIREQHFGVAEGHGWSGPIASSSEPDDPTSNATGRFGVIDPQSGKKIYPVQLGRTARFEDGESLDEVAARTGEAFDKFVMPYVRESVGKKLGEVNIMFVSHGIAVSESIGAIFARAANGAGADAGTWRGLRNTAWTRLVISMVGEKLEYDAEAMKPKADTNVGNEAQDTGAQIAQAVEDANPPLSPTSGEGKEIVVEVVEVNQSSHLEGLVRQKGGIGSMAHDEKQREITEFFGGGGSKTKTNPETQDGIIEIADSD
ncbi:hypothetical protein FRB99_005802 [Tulasnella sp. 403]|nr:hypothetical protein FRB99_005802 [Tulasnella sp. 403]